MVSQIFHAVRNSDELGRVMYGGIQAVSSRLRSVLPGDERGATAVEYGLMVGLIAVGIIAAVTLLKDNLVTLFNTVGTALQNAGK